MELYKIAVFLILFLFVCYIFVRVSKIEHSSIHSIPLAGPPRTSWLLGNIYDLYDKNCLSFHSAILEKFGGAVRVWGLLGEEQLYVSDPLALNHIFGKQQVFFDDTAEFYAQCTIIFGMEGSLLKGVKHSLRKKLLMPILSPINLKTRFPWLYPIAYELRHKLFKIVSEGEDEIDLMNWVSRTVIDMLGQGALGHELNALDDTKVNAFSEALKVISPATYNPLTTLFRINMHYFLKLGSARFRRTIVEWLPLSQVHQLKNALDLISSIFVDAYDRKAVEIQISGKDVMTALMRPTIKMNEEYKFEKQEIVSYTKMLMFAGHDTTTSAVNRILYLLASRHDLQARLRKEVTEAQIECGDMDYESLMNLPLLDAVYRETCRLYPPVPFFGRTPTQDTILPLMFPMKSADGRSEIKEIPVKKNTYIHVSIVGAQRSKAIWGEDAEEFRPERWFNKQPGSVPKIPLSGIYSSLLTYSGGFRPCIGFKLAELEIKLILSALLPTFQFAISREIKWYTFGVQTPVAKDMDHICPQLPLKVSLAD